MVMTDKTILMLEDVAEEILREEQLLTLKHWRKLLF
jgi:hypothetical protein